ncbi:non-ribosomal peptide synthetase [Bacillus pseudomycoides]|uniref:non-ribosomal peptide synthetase n=1 Tax=Bacillus pseudomycoides TaxID=64104 RepID=UPI0023DADDAB|nr:non-ribosomal peptide synthetase [Bacillus pseudomycoides]MDF2086158.1 amino acid adenylation domain-containing protein [Bacillus pseudomycoides]
MKQDLMEQDNDLQALKESSTLPTLKLFTDYSRINHKRNVCSLEESALSPSLTTRLSVLSETHNISMTGILLSTYLVFLHRYTRETNLLVGFQGGLQTLIPLKIVIEPDKSISELIGQIKADYPYINMEGFTEFNSGNCSDSIPAVGFNVNNAISEDNIRMFEKHSSLEIGVTVKQAEGKVYLQWVYNSGLYERETIERMADNFLTLLKNISDNPQTELYSLSLLCEKEKQMLAKFNDTAIPYPRTLAIHQLFEQQVDTAPDSIAVRHKGQNITYKELETRANQMAHMLRARGHDKGTKIGLFLEHSEQKIISILAVLKAGFVYVPLDPDLPQSRLKYILDDCQPAIVITEKHLNKRLAKFTGEVFQLESEYERLKTLASNRLKSNNMPNDLAYIIYTSGSTGRPKGTMLTHQGVCNFVMAQVKLFGIHRDSRILQFASFSFDVSVMETLFALAHGASIVLAPSEELKDPSRLKNLIIKERITFAVLSPSMISQLTPGQTPHLECLVSGGEICPSLLAKIWSKYVHFINAYGPTESTVCSTAWSSKDSNNIPEPLPIGKPLPNCEIHILDKRLNHVPIGVPGEIYIGEPGIARGYLNKEELTRERFIFHPQISDYPLYKTGDLGRFSPDGNIVFLGREDDQVKIRGYRIELQEIETVLLEFTSIREVVVMSKGNRQGEKQIIAYIIPHDNVTEKEIWKYLRESLPIYMLPQYLILMSEFPYSATGKVDRKALPEPDEQKRTNLNYTAPVTQLEKTLAEIWQDVLDIKHIGIYDHFFEFGGHSIKASQAITHINRTFGVQLSQRDIFEYPRVKDLAEFLKSMGERELSKPNNVISRLQKQESYELSFAQKRLWHFDQMISNSTLYNVPICLEINGEVKVDKFHTALQMIVDRHDILRSNIIMEGSQPVQKIKENVSVSLKKGNWTSRSKQDIEQLITDLLLEESNRIFDLEEGPLFNTSLFKISNDKYLFLFNVHHIVFDGWSTDLFLNELDINYTYLIKGSTQKLDALPIQYVDYAAWENSSIDSQLLEKDRAYWLDHLQGELPVINFPTDFARPPIQSYRGASTSREFPYELTSALNDFCREHEVTMYMLVLSAFQTLLYRYTGQQDLIVGTPVANRTYQDTENLIGMFVNVLPVRQHVSDSKSFNDHLKQVKETVLSHLEHKQYGFDKLVEELVKNRDLSHHPIFSVMFVQEHVNLKYTVGDLKTYRVNPSATSAKFDFTLYLDECENSTSVSLEYSTDLFKKETMDRILSNIETLLGNIVKDPQCKIGQLPICSKKERQQLLDMHNSNLYIEKILNIQGEFESQVNTNPEKIAVRFGNHELTYKELNERANQLAHGLRRRNVGIETPVALLFHRSIEMIIGILAVVKAGGYYIPVDPDYPSERINYIIEDSEAEILLTHRQLHKQLNQFKGDILNLDNNLEMMEQEPNWNLTKINSLDDPLYMIYTSGSTGKPKGVIITRANLGRLFDVAKSKFHFNSQDVWTMFHSYCFDFSVWEMYGALLHGGCLVIVSQELAKSTANFLNFLTQERVTVLNQTPSAFYNLIEADANKSSASLEQHIRYVIFGGEALNVQRLRSWMNRYDKQIELVNMYGITETTIHCTHRKISEEDLNVLWQGSPIGYPLDDLQVYLLDKQGELVPYGAVGEIHIAGRGLAKCYFNNPEKTSEMFVESSIPELKGTLLYKSGDLARYNHEGELEYLGRIDHQVKIRGYRIELGEIDAVLASQDDVRNCVTIVHHYNENERQLISYVETNVTRSRGEWHSLLKQFLPEYMIPARIINLNKMPMTQNGKVDRSSLPDPKQFDLSSEHVAPKTTIEQELVNIWREVLSVNEIGVYDNFFEIGGHSLNAMSLINRVNSQYGAKLTYRDVFTHPSVAEQKKLILSEKGVQKIQYAFDIYIGDEITTFYLSQEEYEGQVLPEGAFNVREYKE